jgi:type I restriction enzyme S subunit
MSTERLTPLLVGPCPAEWKQPYIDEVTELLTNGFVGTSLPHQTENSETGIRYLQGFNVRPNKLNLTRTTWVTHDFHAKNRKSQLREGDVLVVQSGHIGTAAVVPKEAAGSNCHAVIICRFKSEIVDPDYASQYLNSSIGQARLRGLHVGSSLPHINTSELGRFKLPSPPRHEQRKLAQLWLAWDAAIEKTEQLIAAKERHRDALIQRLYALSDRRGSESRFRELLKESTEAGNSGRNAKKITVKLYGKGVLAKEEKRQGSEQTQYFIRRAGQLIYSKLDFLNGAFGIVPPELDGFESTLDLPAFDIASTVNPIWLLGYLTRPTYYTHQVGLARGQRKARRVHPSDLLASSLHVPSRNFQDRIAEILTSSQDDIDNSKRLFQSLKTQKRGLMQKLLTGQWRLPVQEEVKT